LVQTSLTRKKVGEQYNNCNEKSSVLAANNKKRSLDSESGYIRECLFYRICAHFDLGRCVITTKVTGSAYIASTFYTECLMKRSDCPDPVFEAVLVAK
jgi:hypothetical protein